jgi:hypothetical protein
LREDLAVVQGTGVGHQQEHGNQQSRVAHTVHHERLRGGLGRGRTVSIEADQQVGADPHPLPAEEHHQVVVGEHEHQHREDEQRHNREVAGEAHLVVHVVDREPGHQSADAGHDEHHHHAQWIDQEAEVDREIATRDESVDRDLSWPRVPHHRSGDEHAGQERREHGGDRHPSRGPVPVEAIAGSGARAVGERCEQW